jgi:hypothetical protein
VRLPSLLPRSLPMPRPGWVWRYGGGGLHRCGLRRGVWVVLKMQAFELSLV